MPPSRNPAYATCTKCSTINETTPDHNMKRTCWRCGDVLPKSDDPASILERSQADLPERADLPTSGKSPLPEPPKKYLALCLPMYRDLTHETWDFVDQLRSMAPPAGWEPINVFPAKSHPVFMTREAIVEMVLRTEKEADIEHSVLLWVDSDCGLTTAAHGWTLVERLEAAPADIGLLGVPCRMRGFEERAANVSHFPKEASFDLGGGVHLPSHEHRTSWLRPFILAEAIGFGVVAMRASIFRRLRKPWFEFKWHPTEQGLPAAERMVGEDINFCRRLRRDLHLQTAVDYGIESFHMVELKASLPKGALHDFNPAATWKPNP